MLTNLLMFAQEAVEDTGGVQPIEEKSYIFTLQNLLLVVALIVVVVGFKMYRDKTMK